ncbi:dTDP-4-amino-4,6-dideoxygalactose transaminase [Gammaproteobacteria bacterium]|nr:dTDP-4-amino-4,6-dideoxygalactose transaminase [Gammaproteobacteria bacterium]
MNYSIPFNRPYMTGRELDYIKEAKANGVLAGNGQFTQQCQQWMESNAGCQKALLTHSCSAALEMAAILLNIEPGDEIIMPSFTFVSTASAFVLRGGVPVFIDIRKDTLNLDETLIEAAITPRTRAIVPVHYAGVACEMDSILAIAQKHGLAVVEDSAQGVMASYKGRALGSIGDLGSFSFHETKNIISGQGGALLINNLDYLERAEIIWAKGTNRNQFLRGEVDKYTWQDIGSSFLPGELTAAFLWAQIEEAEAITIERVRLWNRYHSLLKPLEESGLLEQPSIPSGCEHNAHMYYALVKKSVDRNLVLSSMSDAGINAVFHYVPLHSSPAGKRFGRVSGELAVTTVQSERLIRLPLWVGLSEAEQTRVVAALETSLSQG